MRPARDNLLVSKWQGHPINYKLMAVPKLLANKIWVLDLTIRTLFLYLLRLTMRRKQTVRRRLSPESRPVRYLNSGDGELSITTLRGITYSGEVSKEFWDRVNATGSNEMYDLCCQLQSLEIVVLAALQEKERCLREERSSERSSVPRISRRSQRLPTT